MNVTVSVFTVQRHRLTHLRHHRIHNQVPRTAQRGEGCSDFFTCAASSDLCLNSASFQYYYSADPSYTLLDFCSPFNTSGGPSPDYSPTSPNYRQAFAIPVISNIMKRHYLCSDEPKFPLCSPSGSYSPTAPGYSPSSTGQANDKEDESTR